MSRCVVVGRMVAPGADAVVVAAATVAGGVDVRSDSAGGVLRSAIPHAGGRRRKAPGADVVVVAAATVAGGVVAGSDAAGGRRTVVWGRPTSEFWWSCVVVITNENGLRVRHS